MHPTYMIGHHMLRFLCVPVMALTLDTGLNADTGGHERQMRIPHAARHPGTG